MVLLLLAAVALLCTAVGQLTAVLECLEDRGQAYLAGARVGDMFHSRGVSLVAGGHRGLQLGR